MSDEARAVMLSLVINTVPAAECVANAITYTEAVQRQNFGVTGKAKIARRARAALRALAALQAEVGTGR